MLLWVLAVIVHTVSSPEEIAPDFPYIVGTLGVAALLCNGNSIVRCSISRLLLGKQKKLLLFARPQIELWEKSLET